MHSVPFQVIWRRENLEHFIQYGWTVVEITYLPPEVKNIQRFLVDLAENNQWPSEEIGAMDYDADGDADTGFMERVADGHHDRKLIFQGGRPHYSHILPWRDKRFFQKVEPFLNWNIDFLKLVRNDVIRPLA